MALITKKKSAVATALVFGGAVTAAAVLGSIFKPGRVTTRDWYDALEKPPFNPPNTIFAPVWTTLYVMIAAAGYRIARSDDTPERSRALGWWSSQLALNAAWSPLFFGAKKAELALADIVLMLGAISACILTARKVDRTAAALLLPYLVWVSFATLLNEEIVRRNL
jgi:tryptophan-rich sensory protein